MPEENTALVEINRAQQALERANEIHEIVDLRDRAMAFQIFANAQGFKEAAQEAKIFQLNAERKAGDWLAKNVKAGNPKLSQDATIGLLPEGVDKYESSRWQLEASLPEEEYNNWKDDCLATGKEISAAGLRREVLLFRANNKEIPPSLPNGKYRIIYADPPWKYGNTMPVSYGVQDYHYPTMSIEDLCALPIQEIIEENAVLFLWATSPILEEAFDVIKAWGFEYKTSFIWDKEKHVMGHYNSIRHEFLLVCVRGSCQPDVHKLFDSVYTEPRTTHSTKPEYFRTMIETLYTYGKRIELFARKQTAGWEVFSNESIS